MKQILMFASWLLFERTRNEYNFVNSYKNCFHKKDKLGNGRHNKMCTPDHSIAILPEMFYRFKSKACNHKVFRLPTCRNTC